MNKRTTIGLVALSLVAVTAWMTPSFAAPADKPGALEEKSPAFQGKVEAVDASANTLTVEGKVLSVTTASKLTKADKAIKLADIKVGDRVQGTMKESAGGKTEALTIRVGPQEAGKPEY
jgi:hypothetical protein